MPGVRAEGTHEADGGQRSLGSVCLRRRPTYQALFFRSLQLEGVIPDAKTINVIVLRHTEAKWAADMSDLPPARKAELEPLQTREAVRARIAEIPTRLVLPSECDHQLVVGAAGKLVAEHQARSSNSYIASRRV